MGNGEQDGNKLVFVTEDQKEVVFCVLEQTKLNGINYLLVAEDTREEEAFIMKELSAEKDTEAVYEMVEDEKEFGLIAAIFEELLDDIVTE